MKFVVLMKGVVMRCFSFCVSLCTVVFLLTQFSFAQNVIESTYNQNYKLFTQGIVVIDNADDIVHGVLINTDGVAVPATKFVILGGDEFVFNVDADSEGNFVFDQADVGSYTVVVEYNDKTFNLDFKVTAFEQNTPILANTMPESCSSCGDVEPNNLSFVNGTGVNDSMILVLDEETRLCFAAQQGRACAEQSCCKTCKPVSNCCNTGTSACCATGGGGFGMLGGALGAAGLAAGIAALAINGGSSHVSVGAP